MNNIHLETIYRALEQILLENNLQWVIEQVKEHFRIGKTIEKEITTIKYARNTTKGELLFDVPDSKTELHKGPKATFPITIDYNYEEKVLLLIDAIESVILSTAQMENYLANYLEEEKGTIIENIEYYSEIENRKYSRSKNEMRTRYESSFPLKHILDDLRKEIKKA